MKTRVETIVTIDLSWAANGGEELIDVILPEGTTDYLVTEYDLSESLYIVKQGTIYMYDVDEKCFKKAGLISTNEHNNLMKKCLQ